MKGKERRKYWLMLLCLVSWLSIPDAVFARKDNANLGLITDVNVLNALQQSAERLFRGVVTDQSGMPLPGVAIQVKGTKQGVTTDVNGEYYILVKGVENPVLVFSFVGMETQEVPYKKGQNRVNVTLKESQ